MKKENKNDFPLDKQKWVIDFEISSKRLPKIKTIVIGIIVIFLIICSPLILTTIGHEGLRSVPIATGIVKLNLFSGNIAKVSNNPQEYVLKANDGKLPISSEWLITWMKAKGFVVKDNFITTHMYNKNLKRYIDLHWRPFSSNYTLLTIKE